MLMMRHAPAAIASRAMRTVWIDSSRQIGVRQRLLQRHMIHDVVVIERLLDHEERELVELGEMAGVGQRIRGVRIDHQRHVAEALADVLHCGEIPAGLDLDLDPLIAGGELPVNLLAELIEAVLNPDRDAGGNPRTRAAEHRAERLALDAGIEIPGCHLDRGLRHVVTANRREHIEDFTGMLEATADHPRRDELGDDVPRGFGGLAAVEGVGFGDAFAPAFLAFTGEPDEQEGAIVDAAETRFEESHERQAAES